MDIAIHACQHGTQHYWAKLRNLTDLAHALESLEYDAWDALLATARRQGLYRPMLVGMRLCQDVLGLAIPKQIILAQRRDRLAGWAISFVWLCLSQSLTDRSWAHINFFIAFKLIMAEKKQFCELLTWIGNMLVPAIRDDHWIRLPVFLRWFYPMYKVPLRVIRGMVTLYSWNRLHSNYKLL